MGKILKKHSKSLEGCEKVSKDTKIMAPALLIESKPPKKKLKLSKQQAKTTDSRNVKNEIEDRKENTIEIDYDKLKDRLQAEDCFITSLLKRVPINNANDDFSDVIVPEKESATDGNCNQGRATTAEELKERLAVKLSAFQGKKLDYSEKKKKLLLKRKLHKLEKKKLKRKAKKQKSKIAKLAEETKAATIKTEATETTETIPNRLPKPIFNSEGKMVFSKFDFGETTATSVPQKKNLDPKTALQKIKKEQEKLKKLEEKGLKEKVNSIQDQKVWDSAIKRAEGIKVKDNPELLARSIKRIENKKKKSKKKWNERVEAQEKRQEIRQRKRSENIQAKQHKRKEKKLKRLAKKGKIIV